ncbi:regulation of nuclear pre-mRNA domain-containing protein 2 isoform X2 [Aplysia californica]|uniref:Regulation of nuclear pre-mRNA domain-containing protein 2 isoform X2 n=1 Tax=Aplysia californica TaxID=6500 RepID=A0ABM0JPM1_APLCA|nr:regulation of nuclear pre-mRNA domain-containing protein 2 isoform X2 [Aplysia californica]
MASALNEDSVEKKLKTVNNTQDSIQSLSLWIIHHKSHHGKIVELWMKVLKKTVHPSHRLTLFYLCNDVVQTCKKKKAFIYNSTFKEHLREAAALVRDVSVKGKVERIFNIWEERGVYDGTFIKQLQAILNGRAVKDSKKVHVSVDEKPDNGPVSPPGTPYVDQTAKEPPAEAQANDSMTERDAEESARILAEFKPHEMIDQITAFQRQKSEIQMKVSQLSHLRLDASSIEAIKHLKDRAHGNDFSSHFEDSCMKLEDLVKRQAQHLEDQRALLDTLQTSETFYEEQYREAKIVANAYKNFGARINNMKKRLDELKKSMPEPDSPIPSPDINAPSPGNTPPHVGTSSYGYNPARPSMDYPLDAWNYNGADGVTGVGHSLNDDNTFQESPPLEAPSPEGSPPDLNLGGSETTSASFESRLASFFDRNNQSESSNPPVYTPRLASSNSKSFKLDDEGGTTPLDDETPTTPVQDEHAASPPKRNTPPKKENPIDFLSRLISQTQKNPTTKSGTPSFLDSLTLLSNVGKSATTLDRDSSRDVDTGSQSWASWKSKSNEVNTSPSHPSSPLGYSPAQPTSPTQFPPRTPTMVPPPIPMPVPPPIGMSMSLTMPPPPPPPFTLTAGLATPDFSNPPPGFQQTSPGQKENWPESGVSPGSDLLGGGRSAHNSVLKELVPADSFESKSGSKSPSVPKPSTSVMDPDAMDIVSDEDEDREVGPVGGELGGEAKAEFAQKLKQKTSAQSSLKSHVFVPNPERPNLMTLTVQDDLDEEDMIDEDTVMEDAPSWSSRSRKSSHKSRSRSRSREKERSHRHKKKKKHKRSNYSDDEDSRISDSGNDSKNVGSVVKRVDSRSGSRGRDKGDKFDDKYRDDRYDDRKHDQLEDRDYGSRKPMNRNERGSKEFRDPVEAYTQAYRDAMFQQFNQGRFGSYASGPQHMEPPRRPSFRKY